MEPGKISERQLAFLMTTVLLTTVIFFMPQLGAHAVEQDAWITALIATVWGIFAALLIVALARRFPGLTMIEYLPLILGRPLGIILGLLYAFWFLSVGAFITREFGMFLNITIMNNTPVAVFMFTALILAFYAVRSGLEVWVRVNELLLPLLILSLIAIIVLPVTFMDFRRLLPIGEHSIGALIATSIPSASWRGEIILAGMFIPALTGFRHTTRNINIPVILTGFVLAAVEVATVAAFGGISTGQLEFPLFNLARLISLAKIFDRLEVLIVGVWVAGTFFKLCAFLYCSTVATAQVMGFKEFQFLLLPMSVLMLALADNFFKNVSEITDFLANVWPGYALLSFELIIPLALFLIAIFRPGGKSGAA